VRALHYWRILCCLRSLLPLFSHSFLLSRTQTNICAFFFAFAHSNQYLRILFRFCALKPIFAHSFSFLRTQTNICAPIFIFALLGEIMGISQTKKRDPILKIK